MIESNLEGPKSTDGLSTMLAVARDGNANDVGKLLEATRRYLLLVANRSIDAQLAQKVRAK